ncbi:phage tail tape measure protein [Wolbachia endosymbiont (group A) of Clivina fossor]|uniref:phage tail tape measure protein n=1 Tax=Wolbachia endosymbiont (group A) of Clivina fossor TaxID=3066133 RepID=UPI00313302CA
MVLDIYKKAIEHLADKEKYNASMQDEFNNRANTTANKLQLLKNAVFEAGMNLGSVMLPTLNYVAGSLKAITERIASFAEKHPTLTTAIMSTLAALISLKVLYQTSLLGRQIEYTINSLKPPVIGGKHSFSFVSLLLRIGISSGSRLRNYFIRKYNFWS